MIKKLKEKLISWLAKDIIEERDSYKSKWRDILTELFQVSLYPDSHESKKIIATMKAINKTEKMVLYGDTKIERRQMNGLEEILIVSEKKK